MADGYSTTKCSVCGESFRSSIAKRRHELHCKKGQDKKKWQCQYCNAILPSKQALQNHEVRCNDRVQEKQRKARLDREKELQKRLENQQILDAEQEWDEEPSSKKPRRSEIENFESECGTCNTERNWQCKLCNKRFTSEKLLLRHRRAHYNRKTKGFRCHICDATFSQNQALRDHRKKEHPKTNTSQEPDGNLKCSDCDETFNYMHELFSHRIIHRQQGNVEGKYPTRSVPWERDPRIDPPWVIEDTDGNRSENVNFRNIYMENRDTIQAYHDLGNIRGVYNFPLNNFDGDVNVLRLHMSDILNRECRSFKINLAFGLILTNVETGEYRYYTAYYNNTLLDFPYRIDKYTDVGNFIETLRNMNLLEIIANSPNDSTKWKLAFISNVSYFLYRMGHPIGGNKRDKEWLPDYIHKKKSIISFYKSSQSKHPYKDKLCIFRCLAWHIGGKRCFEKRAKELYKEWCKYKRSEGNILPDNPKKFKGIHTDELPDFEKCFNLPVYVYSLNPDESCVNLYRSIYSDHEQSANLKKEMRLNLYEYHFSLIIKFDYYATKFACKICGRSFHNASNLKKHAQVCFFKVKYRFSGGIYHPSKTIFEEIEETVGLKIDKDLQYFPWFAVFDFEAILKKTERENRDNDTESTKWTCTHIPVCVSVASNVRESLENTSNLSEPVCFVDEDPDNLVKRMCDYLLLIQTEVVKLANDRWKVVFDKLEKEKSEFPTELISVNKTSENDWEEEEKELDENIMEENIGGMDFYDVRKKYAKKVHNLLERFQKYAYRLPVLGFNSAKYDLNLIKKYFPKHLRLAIDGEFIVKKTNQYPVICTSQFSFLDITNFLAAGTSYSQFLAAYEIDETKSYFPYEYLDDASKLHENFLPPYEAFMSHLKNENTLESDHNKWKKNNKTGPEPKSGKEIYENLKQVWKEKKMKTLEDFLSYYCCLDTGPFVKATEKLQKYFFDMHVDVFKIAISAPGVARRLLFEDARKNNKYFASFSQDQEYLYHSLKRCAFGGPSLIFKRHAKVNESYIRNNPDKICKSISGFDANSLYLQCIGERLPTLHPIRRQACTSFKPEVSWRYIEMYQWMNWRMDTDGIHIQHALNSSQEFPVSPYKLDGAYIKPNGTIKGFEFHGCYYHGHNPNECLFNFDDKNEELQKRRIRSEERDKYIRARGIDLEIMYECQFAELKKNNPTLQEYAVNLLPEFYVNNPYKVSQDYILESVESGLFTGMLQVDIKVPEVWPKNKEKNMSPYDYFSEMAPVFCNSEVSFEEWGETMQDYCTLTNPEGVHHPRHLLIGGMAGEKIWLASNLLQWYLQKGMVVTHVYDVLEYRFEKCFETFCDFISDSRRKGDSDPSKAILGQLSKVLGNSAYGSLILDRSKFSKVKYVHTAHEAHMLVNDASFKSISELPGDMYEAVMSRRFINMDLPIQLAFTILQTAKLKLLEFYYDCIDYYVKRDDFELILTDTDSIYMALSTTNLGDAVKQEKREEFYSRLKEQCYDKNENGEPFRCDNGFFFPRECCKKHIKHDKRERGLFKLEASGTEIIALSSKTYHLTKDDGSFSFKAKGINQSALIQNPKEIYLKALYDQKSGCAINTGFRAKDSAIMTYSQKRVGFSFFYVKREVLENCVDTIPLSITLNPWPNYNTYVVDEVKDCISLDFEFFLVKHDFIFQSCLHLYYYEMAVHCNCLTIANEILHVKSKKKMEQLAKKIVIIDQWFNIREKIIKDIMWIKINCIKPDIICNLQRTRGQLIVNPGSLFNNYLTCGISKNMAVITNPKEFPGDDYLSLFWEDLINSPNFMVL